MKKLETLYVAGGNLSDTALFTIAKRMSVHQSMGKQVVMCPYSGILFLHEK
jgi:hypothetical protein